MLHTKLGSRIFQVPNRYSACVLKHKWCAMCLHRCNVSTHAPVRFGTRTLLYSLYFAEIWFHHCQPRWVTASAITSSTDDAGASTTRGATLLGPALFTPRRGDGGCLCRRSIVATAARNGRKDHSLHCQHCSEYEAQDARRRYGAIHGGGSSHVELHRCGEGRRTSLEQYELVSRSLPCLFYNL
jgi:hypothetical protein